MPGRRNQLVTVESKKLPSAFQNDWLEHFMKKFEKLVLTPRMSKPRSNTWNVEAQTRSPKRRSPDQTRCWGSGLQHLHESLQLGGACKNAEVCLLACSLDCLIAWLLDYLINHFLKPRRDIQNVRTLAWSLKCWSPDRRSGTSEPRPNDINVEA